MKEVPKYYSYLIIFRGETEEIQPIIGVYDLERLRLENQGRTHMFDDLLIPILPAVEYCLHMPRIEMDTYDVDTRVLDNAYDVPHNICIIPDTAPFIEQIMSQFTFIIYADNCMEHVKKLAQSRICELVSMPVSELSQDSLKDHWKLLFDKRIAQDVERLEDIDKQFLLSWDKQLILPALATARQYGKVDVVYNKIFNSVDIFETCANVIWNQLVHHNALMSCSSFSGIDGDLFQKMFSESEKNAEKTTRVNVVITMPGIPRRQVKLGGLNPEVPFDEKKVIRLLALHRAIAKDALIIEVPLVGNALFDKLNELEINCKQGTNNKYVKKTLRDIGKLFEEKLTKEQLWAINWAKHITVFSDFPIGLAVIGDADTSLQCYKEISYRPLTPLTRCFQNEMVKHRQIYHGARCKIAFAECVPDDSQNNKLIRATSASLIHSLENFCANNEKMEYVYAETLNVKELKDFISNNSDADILHISGHGSYDRNINMAGLMVGHEFWMGDDNDYRVPPVVILSACHVNPRGSGVVNIADMFLRAGAEAVLGTFIPVDSQRNMILINRLYTYINEAQKGSKMYKTLSEAWSGVVATNAIHEMAASSPAFLQWIMGKNDNGELRLMDFSMKRCLGRLHGSSMYKDTIKIVKEMLHEEEMDGRFDDILSQDNYFPESFFYQWIGFPENIFLYNEVFEKVIVEEL